MSGENGEQGGREWVSVSEYARRRGCSRTAVQKAVAQGRIRDGVRKNERGWWIIDPPVADEEWSRHTLPRKEVELAGREAPGPTAPRSSIADEDKRTPQDLVHARALVEEARAELERIKLEQLRSTLISAEQTAARWFNLGRIVREKLVPLAGRIAEELAAETDPVQVEIRLESEILQVLEALGGE